MGNDRPVLEFVVDGGEVERRDVALRVLKERFRTPSGGQGLWNFRGDSYVWVDGSWVCKDKGWLEDEVAGALAGALLKTPQKEGSGYVTERLAATGHYIKDVAWFLQGLARWEERELPVWVNGEGPDPQKCIAFQDVVVDLQGSLKSGQWVTFPRTENWFGLGTLNVKFVPSAACPVWEECCRQWSDGETNHTERRERLYGYGLMAWRGLGRFGLEYGKPRGGKGMGTNGVLEKLMKKPAYVSTLMRDLAGPHGADGLQHSQILVINEAETLEGREGTRLASILKAAMGRDSIPINVKNLRQMQGVKLGCLPILQSNVIPNLPNDLGGLSSKMVIVPFRKSWVGKEDPGLERKLEGELEGIAVRLAGAAMRLLGESDPKLWFPAVNGEAEVRREYEEETNPWEAFLNWGFVKSESGLVTNEGLRNARRAWEKWSGQRLVRKTGKAVADSHLPKELVGRTSWNLAQWRSPKSGQYLVKGLAMKTKIEGWNDVPVTGEQETHDE